MKKLKILYEDKEIIAVEKDSGTLTIATEKSNQTLYKEVSAYVKKQYPKNKIFIVHRLDKDTSGIVLFAKTEEKKRQLQDRWNSVKREYIAVVEGKLSKKEDTLINYLKEDKTHKVYITHNKKDKEAITKYKVIQESNAYSLLSIEIKTGRKNQIRAQLSHIGHPIIGDKKYNSKKNPLRRLGLHATRIYYKDTKKDIEIISSIPDTFKNIF